MRFPIVLFALTLAALPAAAEPPGVTRAAIFAAEAELAGGPGLPTPWGFASVTEDAPRPILPGAEPEVHAADLSVPDSRPSTEQACVAAAPSPRRFLSWAGRQAPAANVTLRGRSD